MAVGIKVGEVMRKAVINVKKNDPVDKVVKVMGKAKIGGVVVTEKNRVIGVLTEGDIIQDILAKGKDYKKLIVKDVMKHPVRTVTPDIDLEEAIQIMRDLDISRLPVEQGGKLVGLITERDITIIEPSLFEMMREKCFLEAFTPAERKVMISGECEKCGNYSETLRSVNGLFVCEDCRKVFK